MLFVVTNVVHVNRVRLDGGLVEAAIADARDVARAEAVPSVLWWVGDQATPAALGEHLVASGLLRVQTLTSMALTREPTGTPTLPARNCDDLAEFTAAQELDWSVAGLEEAHRAKLRGRLAGQWEREGRFGRTFVVAENGVVISVGRAHYAEDAVFLTGGATAPHTRGRGAYTSLVHARWREAMSRATPRLITQASADSQPILTRLGFEALGTIALYRDEV